MFALADDSSLLLLEWDSFVSYLDCWTAGLGSDHTLPAVQVEKRDEDGGRGGGGGRREKEI